MKLIKDGKNINDELKFYKENTNELDNIVIIPENIYQTIQGDNTVLAEIIDYFKEKYLFLPFSPVNVNKNLIIMNDAEVTAFFKKCGTTTIVN